MRRALPAAALAALFLAAFAAGAFFADPIGLVAGVAALRYRSAGALSTYVPGPDGGRLHAVELGPRSAEVPVVLLHGLGAASHYWVETALDLARAREDRDRPRLPGSGRATRPRRGTGWGIPGRVAAVSALLDALRIRKVDLVGHSLGGWTAGAFALAEPHRVRRLVLVDSAGFTKLDPGPEEALRRSLSPGDRAGARRLYDLLFFRKPFPAAGFFVDALGPQLPAGERRRDRGGARGEGRPARPGAGAPARDRLHPRLRGRDLPPRRRPEGLRGSPAGPALRRPGDGARRAPRGAAPLSRDAPPRSRRIALRATAGRIRRGR